MESAIMSNLVFILYILISLMSIVLNLINYKLIKEENFGNSILIYLILLHIGMNIDNIYRKILVLFVMFLVLIKDYKFIKCLKK
jgi:hypothetical protein